MSQRANDLKDKLQAFNKEFISFIESCSDEDWKKMCEWEKWSVGVTAHHVGALHYGTIDMARNIVNGEQLPALTEKQLIEMDNQLARENASITREEVLAITKTNGDALAKFAAGLTDEELDRKGYLELMKTDVSTQQFLEAVIVQSGGEHLANMRKAVGR